MIRNASVRTAVVFAAILSLFFSPVINISRARAATASVPDGKIVAAIEFDPVQDGFGFENYGKDGHDGHNDLGAVDMVRMFGAAAVCKNPGATAANCVMKASARGWMDENLESMGGGHCEGMAVVCLRFKEHMPFKGKAEPGEFQRGAKLPFDLKLDPVIANYIAYYWATQSFNEIAEINQDSEKKGPLNVVNTLIQAFNDGTDTYTLGICQRKKSGCEEGHAITPFAVEDAGTQYKIHVYDNNYPGKTRFVTVEKGVTQKWSYITSTNPSEAENNYVGDINSKSLSLTPTSKREGQCFAAPFDESAAPATGCGYEPPRPAPVKPGEAPKPPATPAKPAGPAPARTRYADFFLTGDGDMMIMDAKDRRLGYDPDADDYFDEIPGGKIEKLVGGMGYDMPHYKIPLSTKEEPYIVVFSGANLEEESEMNFVFTGPGFSVGFEGIRLDPKEFMVAGISSDGERISMEMSNDGEMPEVYYHVDTPKKSYMAEVRAALPAKPAGAKAVTNAGTDVAAFESAAKKEGQAPNQLTIDFKDDSKLQISDNIEGDANYDVDIEQFDAAGKIDKIQLNDVGKGDGGADAYEIEIGKWDGSGKIAVRHDEKGDGFDNDEEEMDQNEPNDIKDDPDKPGGGSGLMSFFFRSLSW